jgi:hypothetical protein
MHERKPLGGPGKRTSTVPSTTDTSPGFHDGVVHPVRHSSPHPTHSRLRALAFLLALPFSIGTTCGEDFNITVEIFGALNATGSGRVTAADPLLDCQILSNLDTIGTCSDTFEDLGGGGTFTLVAHPDAGSEFAGWTCSVSGPGTCEACQGTGNCQLSFDASLNDEVDFDVTARFDLAVDDDGDGVPSASDNCPDDANPDQADTDQDGAGDVCDPDDDQDNAPDTADNCPSVSNPDQADTDQDGIGDACDTTADFGLFVLGDQSLFRDERMAPGSENAQFFSQLIDFTPPPGPRAVATDVLLDCRGNPSSESPCVANPEFALFRQLIGDSDIQVVGASFAAIPPDVKTFVAYLRTSGFTAGEIAALKSFIAEGGRVVYLTEGEGQFAFFGWAAVTNAFLTAMGSTAINTGGVHDPGIVTLPGSSIGSHPVMNGVTSLVIGSASAFNPGAQDAVLYRDSTGGFPLGIATRTSP